MQLLSEISIKNFAIIEELEVTFDEGLTVLTGETGAGKSIIIDAVQLLAGGRGSRIYPPWSEKSRTWKGCSQLKNQHILVIAKLAEFGIDVEDGPLFYDVI